MDDPHWTVSTRANGRFGGSRLWNDEGVSAAEQELMEAIREASWIFTKKEHGRFQGSAMACRAVARFLCLRGYGAELAAPFLQIAEAFIDLDRGGQPRLFARKTEPEKERDRSPERKHAQRLAAMCLEFFVSNGDDREISATLVARHVSKWPDFQSQTVTEKTIIAWRKKWNHDQKFETLVAATLAEPNPRATVEGLLRKGPPGSFRG